MPTARPTVELVNEDCNSQIVQTMSMLLPSSSSSNDTDTTGRTTGTAGASKLGSSTGSTGTTTPDNNPTGLAVDRTSSYLFYTDYNSNLIRKVTILTGSVVNIASGFAWISPMGIIVDSLDRIFVSDQNRISLIPHYNSTTASAIAGSSVSGFQDGSNVINQRRKLAKSAGKANEDTTDDSALFLNPIGLAIDNTMLSSIHPYLYVADNGNNAIRRVTLDGADYPVTTIVESLLLGNPYGLAFDSIHRELYISSYSGQRILKISVSSLTESSSSMQISAINIYAGSVEGFANGFRSTSIFHSPSGLALDSNLDLYISDRYEYTTRDGTHYLHSVRKISFETENITTVAGGSIDCLDSSTSSIAAGKSKLRVASSYGEGYNSLLSGRALHVKSIGGSSSSSSEGFSSQCTGDGFASDAQFFKPAGLAFTHDGVLYVADSGNGALRNIACSSERPPSQYPTEAPSFIPSLAAYTTRSPSMVKSIGKVAKPPTHQIGKTPNPPSGSGSGTSSTNSKTVVSQSSLSTISMPFIAAIIVLAVLAAAFVLCVLYYRRYIIFKFWNKNGLGVGAVSPAVIH